MRSPAKWVLTTVFCADTAAGMRSAKAASAKNNFFMALYVFNEFMFVLILFSIAKLCSARRRLKQLRLYDRLDNRADAEFFHRRNAEMFRRNFENRRKHYTFGPPPNVKKSLSSKE
jgi:hypothetical protein